MLSLPPKIRRDDNQASSTYPSNKHGLYLFNFLKSLLAFGKDDPNDEWIIDLMYEPWHKDDDVTKKDNKYYKGYNWARNRIKGLKRKIPTKNFTHLEADFLHVVFTNATSEEWGAVTPEELVTRNIHDIVRELSAEGLKWPNCVPTSFALNSVFQSSSDSSMKISFIEAEELPKRAMINAEEPANFAYPKDERPVHPRMWKFVINVSGINLLPYSLFVFETYDTMASNMLDAGNLFDIFPQNLVTSNDQEIQIRHRSGNVFRISEKLPGGFQAHALVFPSDWNFKEKFGVAETLNCWTEEEAVIFLKEIQKRLIEQPEVLQMASYSYFVP